MAAKRYDMWVDEDVQNILEGLEKGKKAKYVNDAVRFYHERAGKALDEEREAKLMADRIAVHLLKKLKIE